MFHPDLQLQWLYQTLVVAIGVWCFCTSVAIHGLLDFCSDEVSSFFWLLLLERSSFLTFMPVSTPSSACWSTCGGQRPKQVWAWTSRTPRACNDSTSRPTLGMIQTWFCLLSQLHIMCTPDDLSERQWSWFTVRLLRQSFNLVQGRSLTAGLNLAFTNWSDKWYQLHCSLSVVYRLGAIRPFKRDWRCKSFSSWASRLRHKITISLTWSSKVPSTKILFWETSSIPIGILVWNPWACCTLYEITCFAIHPDSLW